MNDESPLEKIGLPPKRTTISPEQINKKLSDDEDMEYFIPEKDTPSVFAIDRGDGWESGLVEEPLIVGDAINSYFEENDGFVVIDED